MKKQISILAAAFLLAACSNSTESSDTASASQTEVTTTTTAAATTTASENESKAPVETKKITAEAKAYKDGMLTFEYKGKEYTLPLGKDNHVISGADPLPGISYGEMIINNPYGVKIMADITITADMTEIKKCDVEKNVTHALDELNSDYHMRHHEGSVYTIASDTKTYYLDLNALDNMYKEVVAEDDPVRFDGFALDGDKLVIGYISRVTDTYLDKEGNVVKEIEIMNNEKKPCYFGIIRSLDADKAVVKLNYTGKELTVPSCLTDGELKEGAQVAVILNDTPEELMASKEQERDHAVFCTDIEKMLDGSEKFEDVAYCMTKPTFEGYTFVLTRIDELTN